MTLKELSQLYYLNREIEMDQRRLHELEAKALPGASVITGTPTARMCGTRWVTMRRRSLTSGVSLRPSTSNASMSGAVWSAT